MSLCVCVCACFALVTEHAKRMRRTVLSSVVSPPLQHFSTLPHKRHDCRKKVFEHKIFVFIFSATSRRLQRDFIINVRKSQCKVPVILSEF